MIAFRKAHAAVRRGQFYRAEEVAWHGTKLNEPGWSDPEARALALTLAGSDGDADIHIMMNMYWDRLDFELPPGRRWSKAVDMAAAPPHDMEEPGSEPPVAGSTYTLEGRSVVVLISE